jgi:thioredoxin reductase (NADPH)
MSDKYDLIIIGAGPSGLSAGIYAGRSGLATLILEKAAAGGQALSAHTIENYPGFSSISGAELVQRMIEQAESSGAKIVTEEAKRLERRGEIWVVNEHLTRAVIIATGASPKRLNVLGEREFLGKGVSFCATCDGKFFEDKIVAVIGGGDKALSEALYLSKIARKVYLVHRRRAFRATAVLQERVFSKEKIEPIWSSTPLQIEGRDKVSVIKIEEDGKERELKVDGVFVAIGIEPSTGFLKDVIDLDERGFVLTDSNMKTSEEGVYAAGDVRSGSLHQVVTATGDGAVAAISVYNYLSTKTD